MILFPLNMPEGLSVINLGELSKPATVLIEKIADATGGIFRPFQIRRVAQAEADAEIIKASAKIEVIDLERRALHRFIREEAKKQSNIESITQKALPAIEKTAQPEKIEDDWITNFFDKCRIISDEQMQNLWSKVLAGEANLPGRFSKRTVNLLASFERSDAELFSKLCSFVLYLGDKPIVMVDDWRNEIYIKAGIDSGALKHLDTIGLISFQPLSSFQFVVLKLPSQITLTYFGSHLNIKLPNPENNMLEIGKASLTKAGKELTLVCNAKPCESFRDYIFRRWKGCGLLTSGV